MEINSKIVEYNQLITTESDVLFLMPVSSIDNTNQRYKEFFYDMGKITLKGQYVKIY